MQNYNNNQFNAGGDIKISSHSHGTNWKAREILLENSAPAAFHNSGERFDRPKCHAETRTHILTKIMDWVVGEVGWEGFIKWLYGPAGAGKSAIAQTIAEMCHDRHLLLATFFFSRMDSKRNNEKCLIATIAYQIALNAPMTRDAIEAAVDRDPAIFQCSIEAQLETLIINPLTQLSQTGAPQSSPVPNLIIIDGLDECNDYRVQQHILHTISVQLRPDVPLKFLICSRAEPHLTLEFTPLTSEGMATCLSLEDGYEDADIKRYLIDSFRKIATTHPLKAHIPSAWPTNDVISTLVRKSSGQFIFAATVVKYISSHRGRPTRCLEIILGMQPPRNDRPSAALDALYTGILSLVEDVKATLRLLGVLILSDHIKTLKGVGEFMFLDPDEAEHLLLDLTSVVECLDMNTQIRMLHASFPDFLFDQSRSGEYYIDASMIHAEIAQLCFSHIKVHESADCARCLGGSALRYALNDISKHLSKAELSADLRKALLNTCYITVVIRPCRFGDSSEISSSLANFLLFLKGSKFTDTEDLYLHHRNIYDRIMCKRIADLPLDFGSTVGLVSAGLGLYTGLWKFDECFTDYFSAFRGRLSSISPILYFLPQGYRTSPAYLVVLTEFLTDPGRAGEYALDGPKFALVAKFLLDHIISPCPEGNFFRDSDGIFRFLYLSSDVGSILSKKYWYAYEDRVKEKLRTLINGIGDYLTRVIGSVPIDLKITLRIYDVAHLLPGTVGPLYYEGQGQPMAESEEAG